MNDQYRFTKDWPYHISCGGVVYRHKNGKLEVLVLVHHTGEYDLPKGTLHHGETLEHCALRETEEESGQKAEITGYLGGQLAEWFDDARGFAISKITHYFALKWLADTGVHDTEYARHEWVAPEDAQKLLAQNSAEIVRRFVAFASTL